MRKALLGVVVLVVLAGCSTAVTPPGVQSASDASVNGASDTHIVVENGTLPLDADALFVEVTQILETGAQGPERIVLEPDEEMAIQREPMPPFYRLVGIERPSGASRTATALGWVGDPATVHVHEKLADDEDQLPLTLTHEFVHVVQKRTDAVTRLQANVPDENTTDAVIVRRSVLEGAATSVETVYWDRHGGGATSPAEGMERSFESTAGARQWIYASYHVGYEYVQARTASPAAIDRLYDDPPHTSEELLHGLPGGSEPRPPLAVEVKAPDWRQNGTDRTGELFVRVALDTELPGERAADAAAGWGTDTRVALERGDDRAYVWALRWDDAANATEFEDAMRAYLGERATERDGVWVDGDAAFGVTRVDDETVTVVLGNRSFVETARVTGTNGSVSVST